MQQDEALDLLKLGKNVFLTGAAGAGKTYLLNKYIKYLKDNDVKVAITASTGIAATHLQGVTIHSWSGIGVKDDLTNKDLEKILKTSRLKRNYTKTKVLIIDEISMLHAHQLDMVDRAARHVRDNNDPFGGIQVVLCGDFFQLPPVSSGFSAERTKFAFESDSWASSEFHVCYIEEQHRQNNDPLLQVLNDIRSGTAGENTKIPLRTRYKKEPEGETKATKLYARNINVDSINQRELELLDAKSKTYEMSTYGFPALVDGLKKSCLAPDTLTLKIGAEVMFVKNDQFGEFVNGTRGVIVGFGNDKGWPVVKTYNGDIITAVPEEWKFEDNGTVRATIEQVPLRLAWAITIHKSQGMTLDAAEMDLGDVFEPGMGYVALSRVRSLGGLKILNLNEIALQVHPKILEQDKIFRQESEVVTNILSELSESEKEAQQNEVLFDRFKAYRPRKGEKPIPKEQREKKKKEPKTETHLVTLQMLKDNKSIADICDERSLKATTILGHIEKLRGAKLLDESYFKHLKNALPANDFKEILSEIKKSEDGQLKPIFEKFDGKYTYEDLKIVRLFAA